jgi:hypothetical protein
MKEMDEEKTEAAATVTNEKKMDAQTILASKKYAPHVNLLWAILDDGVMYTESQVDQMIQEAQAHVVTKDINE